MLEKKQHGISRGGFCACPECGQKTAHKRDIPCQDEKCPACGAKILREGSYHHDLLVKKKKKPTQMIHGDPVMVECINRRWLFTGYRSSFNKTYGSVQWRCR